MRNTGEQCIAEGVNRHPAHADGAEVAAPAAMAVLEVVERSLHHLRAALLEQRDDQAGPIFAHGAMHHRRQDGGLGELGHDPADGLLALMQEIPVQLLQVLRGQPAEIGLRGDRQVMVGKTIRLAERIGPAFDLTRVAHVDHGAHAELRQPVSSSLGQSTEVVGPKQRSPPQHAAVHRRVASGIEKVARPLDGRVPLGIAHASGRSRVLRHTWTVRCTTVMPATTRINPSA